MLEKFLEEIGLSDKEALVYLALLQVENAAISDIAKKTGINRTTVYPVIQSLEKKGLASEVPIGKTDHYQAAPPESLATYVERQKVILEEHGERLKDLIPRIKSIEHKGENRPTVKFFDGRDGAIEAYTEFYRLHDTETKEGYFIFNQDLLSSVFTEKERQQFRKIRVGKKVTPTSIYTNSKGDSVFTGEGKRVRIDEKKYPITCDISIVEDQVIITTLGNQVSAVLIRSKEFAETLKTLVNLSQEKDK